MTKIIQLWQYQAIAKGLEALTEFEETGSREGFKRWRKEYRKRIDKKKENIIAELREGEGLIE